jgi:hypothetical protein
LGYLNGVSALKIGFVDLAAIFFIVGGIVSLVMSILTIPISTVYPFTLPTTFTTPFLVTLVIGLVCSLGAVHCYSLATKRLLSEAGMRGIIFGALLLIFSLGLFGSIKESDTSALLTTVSSILILIAGAICFVLKHSIASASSIVHQQSIPQRV